MTKALITVLDPNVRTCSAQATKQGLPFYDAFWSLILPRSAKIYLFNRHNKLEHEAQASSSIMYHAIIYRR
jgi:hypothetical protein